MDTAQYFYRTTPNRSPSFEEEGEYTYDLCLVFKVQTKLELCIHLTVKFLKSSCIFMPNILPY
jgi:hypothetical protein